MFSKDITGSDAFREMPASSQALYFHLGMEADDDGFLDNYRGLMRGINASDDDLKILISKRFLILFPSKVIVVKHWLINNTVRKDRYNKTKHLEEKRALIIKENGSYTEYGLPSGNQVATQERIGEDRREEDSSADAENDETVLEKTDEEGNPLRKREHPEARHLIELFKGINPAFKQLLVRKVERAAASRLLELQNIEYWEEFLKGYEVVLSQDRFCPKATTPSKFEQRLGEIEAYRKQLKNPVKKTFVI